MDLNVPNKESAITLLKLALSAVVLYLLVDYVGWKTLLNALSQTKWSWLLAMFLCSAAGHLVEAHQMSRILEKTGVAVSSLRVFLANTQSTLYSLILPGDLASSITKWANLSAATGEKARVMSAIIYNRLAVILPVFGWGGLAYFWDTHYQELNSLGTAIMMLGGFSIVLFIVFVRFRSIINPWINRLSEALSLPNRFKEKMIYVVRSLKTVESFSANTHLQFYVLGTLVLFLSLISFKCASAALNVEISLLTLAWIEMLLTVSRLLPISIANLGVREGLLIFVLAPLGLEPAVAVGLGLLLFTRILLFALIGAGYQIALAANVAAWKPPAN